MRAPRPRRVQRWEFSTSSQARPSRRPATSPTTPRFAVRASARSARARRRNSWIAPRRRPRKWPTSNGKPERSESRRVADYSIVRAGEAKDAYASSDVPGEFRSLKDALGSEQVAVTLIRVPPHSDFEQGTGHHHEELE